MSHHIVRLLDWGRSLRGRLIASYVFVVLVTLVVAVGALSVLLPIENARQIDERLLFIGRPAQRLLTDLNNRYATPDEMRLQLNEYAEAAADPAGIRIVVIAPSGLVLLDTDERGSLEGRPFQLPGAAVPNGPVRPTTTAPRGRFVAPDRTVYRYVVLSNQVQRPNRSNWIQMVVAQPERGWATMMGDLLQRLALASLVALAIAGVVATLVARSLYRPIARLTAASEAMARGQYDQQVAVEGPAELAGLARSFNRMADEIKTSRETVHEFVANVSHELRTPLTSIRGFVEALRDGTVTDEAGRERSLAIIQGELRRLQRLVNSLLDLSRIESGQADLRRSPVDVVVVVRQCAEIVAQRAEEAGVDLIVDLPGQPPTVIGDADRLEQVITNLLDNALRYTAAGGRVSLALSGVGAQVVIAVADTGAGIPAAALPHLFDRFYTADPARVGSGAGLGLAIAREIVLAHGGEIAVASQPGHGSTFTITLPAALVTAPPSLSGIR